MVVICLSDIVEKISQNIFLYDRNKLVISGIASVESFDESGISAVTVSGETLIIEGSDISVTDVNLESRQLNAQGIFSGFFYNDDHKEKRKHSLLSSLFGKL